MSISMLVLSISTHLQIGYRTNSGCLLKQFYVPFYFGFKHINIFTNRIPYFYSGCLLLKQFDVLFFGFKHIDMLAIAFAQMYCSVTELKNRNCIRYCTNCGFWPFARKLNSSELPWLTVGMFALWV